MSEESYADAQGYEPPAEVRLRTQLAAKDLKIAVLREALTSIRAYVGDGDNWPVDARVTSNRETIADICNCAALSASPVPDAPYTIDIQVGIMPPVPYAPDPAEAMRAKLGCDEMDRELDEHFAALNGNGEGL